MLSASFQERDVVLYSEFDAKDATTLRLIIESIRKAVEYA